MLPPKHMALKMVIKLILQSLKQTMHNFKFKPFLAHVFLSYPLKTTENICFSCIFREYKIKALARNPLSNLYSVLQIKNLKLGTTFIEKMCE